MLAKSILALNRGMQMKYFGAVIFVFVFALYGFSQDLKVTGTIFDPNGALVTNAQIRAVDEKNRSKTGSSNSEGIFEIQLVPGIYAIYVTSPGFLTIKLTEFLVVNSTTGKMTIDFVMIGRKSHEPCGYSGADCLPAKKLIRSYEIKYLPKLRNIRDEFARTSERKQKRSN